jgi:putative DNA primase/helicase
MTESTQKLLKQQIIRAGEILAACNDRYEGQSRIEKIEMIMCYNAISGRSHINLRDFNNIRCDPPLTHDELIACNTHTDDVISGIQVLEERERQDNTNVQTLLGSQYNDRWNAERFTAYYGNDVRYCASNKKWYVWWNELFWREDDANIVRSYCSATIGRELQNNVNALNQEFMKHIRSSCSAQGIRNMLYQLESNMLPVREDELNIDPDRVNVLNGVFNTKTLELEDPCYDRFITKKFNVNYNKSAECPKWIGHLNYIFCKDDGTPDVETIKSFQQICGYFMLPKNPRQLFFVAYGKEGENGKSMTFATIYHILGDYAKNADYRTFLRKKHITENARDDLARLYGNRFVTAYEGDESGELDLAIIKAITGGDIITSRALYEKAEEKTLPIKVVLATNHKPVIKDISHSVWRRIILIPFTRIIEESKRIDDFKDILIEERDGIFAWMVEGLRSFYTNKNRLKLSAKITQATAAYKSASDELGEFFKKFLIINKIKIDLEKDLTLQDTFENFKQWHIDLYGEYPKQSKKEFGVLMEERGAVRHRTSRGWVWMGVQKNPNYIFNISNDQNINNTTDKYIKDSNDIKASISIKCISVCGKDQFELCMDNSINPKKCNEFIKYKPQ